MLFAAEPKQVSDLSSIEFVKLMKLLMHAEARLADIPLRSATVPMQITVADGGEDGRVEWTGGASTTNYFPSSFCIFQSKAQDLNAALVRAEVLAKSQKKKGKSARIPAKSKPMLTPAVVEALTRRGSYIVFCSRPFVTKKINALCDAIKNAIRDAGKRPDRLAAIEVYDANKIADWINSHPSVALWLAAHARKRSVAGFLTIDGWAKSPDVRTGTWVGGDTARFTGMNILPAEGEQGDPRSNYGRSMRRPMKSAVG